MIGKGAMALAAVAAIAVSGCAASAAESPKDSLERTAHQLDVLAANREDAKAWEFYSQRCKDDIGDVSTYSYLLDEFFRGRSPKFVSATARVNGSSGQVVSVDTDPSAPASSMLPRTWTFIDGKWQFDNC